ncbi:hypothetical protein [Bacillus sp. B1-b2]|uniref:hypothetical protein n=1 Tax=Bacillus sp. B1-b2 TaxID=2653201 RepID=UPI0012628272|nr:hypothetical protein [Bacillus sp. B1-b2]KAB7672066.1 hypothetical protein F9279_03850 [Bacillus sp. B1-b2]
MKYQQKDFTEELRKKIETTESSLKKHTEKLLNDYKSIFVKQNLEFDADFDKEGEDPFMPGYISSVAIVISDKNGDIIDLRIINIWECKLTLLGMRVLNNIPGSKISGELLNESFEEINEELKDYIEDVLQKVI